MGKIAQIVFFTLPLLIALRNLDILNDENDKEAKVKRLLIRCFLTLFLIALNFMFSEQIGRNDMALIGALIGIVFLVLFFLIIKLIKKGTNFTFNKILCRDSRTVKVEKVNNLGFTINGENGENFYEWGNIKFLDSSYKCNFTRSDK